MYDDWAGKTYWLVGASEGLGRALAHQLSRMGVRVIVSARSQERLDALVAELPGPARAIAMDVSDPASVRAAAGLAGPVHGLVYLAGVYWPMRAQDWKTDQVQAMMDINVTGAMRVIGEVLPGMVARERGHIVLTGSLSGFRGLPGAIGYGASKAAIMHLAESMRADLLDSGVNVQLANPGFIKTRLTDKNDFAMPFLMTPEEAADAMVRLMGQDRFQSSFPGIFSLLFRASRWMPDWLFHKIFPPSRS